jgi:hypothetical protein
MKYFLRDLVGFLQTLIQRIRLSLRTAICFGLLFFLPDFRALFARLPGSKLPCPRRCYETPDPAPPKRRARRWPTQERAAGQGVGLLRDLVSRGPGPYSFVSSTEGPGLLRRIERIQLPPDTAGMAKKPEPPPELTAWSVYKFAKKAVWLGVVEAPSRGAPDKRPCGRCRQTWDRSFAPLQCFARLAIGAAMHTRSGDLC